MRVFYKIFLVCMVISVCAQGGKAHAKAYGLKQILDPTMHNICAITFDDGPHPRTVHILDVLKEENIRATFFVLGSQVQYFPQIAKRIYQEGHEIANHSYTHPALTQLSDEGVKKELERTNAVIQKNGIPRPRFLRPPLGAYNGATMRIVNELGMDLVLWSTDSYDWQGRPDYSTMPNMAGEAMTDATQRGIFLFHDTKRTTSRDAKLIVMVLRAIGCKEFVTVSEYFDLQASPELLAMLRKKMNKKALAEAELTVEVQGAQEAVPQAAEKALETPKEAEVPKESGEAVLQ